MHERPLLGNYAIILFASRVCGAGPWRFTSWPPTRTATVSGTCEEGLPCSPFAIALLNRQDSTMEFGDMVEMIQSDTRKPQKEEGLAAKRVEGVVPVQEPPVND